MAPARNWDERAADRMAAAVDFMIHHGQLDARSAAADARLDYQAVPPLTKAEAERVIWDGADPRDVVAQR